MTRKDIAKKLVEALPGEFSRQDTQLSFDFAASAPRGIKKAETYVQVVIRAIKHTLLLGESVEISGFGKFIIRRKKERLGRNPVTREEAVITARKVVSFKPSKMLKNVVNNNQN